MSNEEDRKPKVLVGGVESIDPKVIAMQEALGEFLAKHPDDIQVFADAFNAQSTQLPEADVMRLIEALVAKQAFFGESASIPLGVLHNIVAQTVVDTLLVADGSCSVADFER